MTTEVRGVEGMRALVGQEVGQSKWRKIAQADIDAFAELSGDHQWIHVDPERAKTDSPYGTTTAHANPPLPHTAAFAAPPGDPQGIHVAPERAKTESPYGTTIAHGNLTLATVDGFRGELISST